MTKIMKGQQFWVEITRWGIILVLPILLLSTTINPTELNMQHPLNLPTPKNANGGYIGGPYEQLNDTRFGVAHFEMINPTQFQTGLEENYFDPLLHQSAVMLREAGACWNRFEFHWETIQPTNITWDWSDIDAYMNLSDYYGLRILPVLAYGTPWACEGGDPQAPIENITAWRQYVHAVVDRYASRPSLAGGYWQIWNEPMGWAFFHGDFVTDFLPIMVAAAEEIKITNATAKVVACSLTESDMGGLVKSMVDGIGRDLFNQLFDTVAIHPYGQNMEKVVQKIQAAKDVLAGWYRGELWITEVGWIVNPNILGEHTDYVKAQNVAKVLVKSRAMNVSHTLIHMWCDWGDLIEGRKVQNATYGEHWYGIVDINANPNISYFTFKAVANAIGNGIYLGEPERTGFNFAQAIDAPIFRNPDGTLVSVFWNSLDNLVPVTLHLPAVAQCVLYNTTGSILKEFTGIDSISLVLSSDLQLLAINMTGVDTTGLHASDFILQFDFNELALVAFIIIPGVGIITVLGVWWEMKKGKKRE